jgi:death-on-curing protein
LPGSTVRFLTLDEVLAVHAAILAMGGGSAGIRDLGLLESALYRPRSGYYEDVVEMAAALFESLLGNHPFVDGNKRVAVIATDAFLRLNGWRLAMAPARAHAFLMGLLECGQADMAHLLPWLRRALRRLPS